MSEPIVLMDIDDTGVATVTLNRADVNNAYNADMIMALLGVFEELGNDERVRVVVIRGAGKHFQAGADLKWIDAVRQSSPEENLAVSRRTASAVRGLNEFPRPTIALVQGGCFGGGIGLIAACDVVIAETSAIFSISEARWGLMASIIVPQLNAAMGVRQVRRYALSCERFNAERAKEMGLVHEVCAPGALDEVARGVIESFLLSEPNAMAQTKHFALDHARLHMSDEYFDKLVSAHAASRQSDLAAEGLASFVEKRKPSWYPAQAKA